MKKNNLLALIISAILILNCSDKTSTPTVPEEPNNSAEIAKLFPAEVGKSFVYNVDSYDKTNASYVNLGTRTMSIDRAEADYYVCSEIYDYLQNANLLSKVKLSENTVEFYSDNEGASQLIPDSLAGQVQLELDETFKVLQLPLEANSTWDVYNGKAVFGTFKFNVFGLKAKYIGSESVVLGNASEAISAERIEYTISINIPDMANLFANNLQTYSANVWFAEDFGVVKVEGCALFVNPITGNNFDMSDSNKVIRHTLIP
ncbi:MAG: hypothetical protein H6613_10340 [Ignavibacteriales bacterium]|nr:hypothetical protein [Ignavibacteriota bacterium]MCB9248900.1 hypothetical protein [Ignavibacteriales bacterium]